MARPLKMHLTVSCMQHSIVCLSVGQDNAIFIENLEYGSAPGAGEREKRGGSGYAVPFTIQMYTVYTSNIEMHRIYKENVK